MLNKMFFSAGGGIDWIDNKTIEVDPAENNNFLIVNVNPKYRIFRIHFKSLEAFKTFKITKPQRNKMWSKYKSWDRQCEIPITKYSSIVNHYFGEANRGYYSFKKSDVSENSANAKFVHPNSKLNLSIRIPEVWNSIKFKLEKAGIDPEVFIFINTPVRDSDYRNFLMAEPATLNIGFKIGNKFKAITISKGKHSKAYISKKVDKVIEALK